MWGNEEYWSLNVATPDTERCIDRMEPERGFWGSESEWFGKVRYGGTLGCVGFMGVLSVSDGMGA